MNIRKFLSLLFCLFPLFTMAQVIQPCVVKQYNQNEPKTPLSGVQVEVRGAGTEVSDAHGNLTLTFTTLKPGDRVTLRSITKNGYEVFNTSAVEQWTLSRNNTPFLIVLVRSDYMIQLKNSLKQNSLENYKLKLDQTKKELKKERDAGKLRDEDYRKQIDALEDQYDKALQNLDNYIDRFAHIDLSEVNKEEQRILELVQKGHINEAVEAYESLRISDKLLKERNDLKKIDTAAKKLEEKRKQKQDNIDALNEALNREITTLMLAGGQDNFDKIGNILKEQALADTTDFERIVKYADFLHDQGHYQEAIRYCFTALNNRSSLFDKDTDEYRKNLADVQNDLGILFRKTRNYAQSEQYLLAALENRNILFIQNPEYYRKELAATQNNLGNLYSKLNDYSKSERYYLYALDNYTILFNQNSEIYREDFAMIQNNLGSLYGNMNDYVQAKQYLLSALDNRKILYESSPETYRKDLAEAHNNLGNLYIELHEYEQAERHYLSSLEYRIVLFEQNPDRYRISLASSQLNLGVFYKEIQEYTQSERYYLLALDNYNILFRQSPDAFRANVAKLQSNLGNLYKSMNDFSNAEKYHMAALDNRTILFNQNSRAYRVSLANSQYNIGSLYEVLQDYPKSEQYYLYALDNFTELFNQNPNRYRKELAMTQNNLGVINNQMHDYSEAEHFFSAALANFSILSDQNPQAYRKRVAIVQKGLAFAYAHNLNFSLAIEAVNNSITLFPNEPEPYEAKGEILLMQGDEKGALEMWNKVLELDADFEKHMEEMGSASELYKQLKEQGLVK